MTLTEVASLLQLSEPTAHAWLTGGHFPGATQAPNGEWHFSTAQVMDVKARIDELRIRNANRDLAPPDEEDS